MILSVQLPLNAESTHSTVHTHIPQLTQPVVKREPPPYGRRKGWVPRSLEDYGDGGAFPEIHIAQYPMNMGKKGNVVSHFFQWPQSWCNSRTFFVHFCAQLDHHKLNSRHARTVCDLCTLPLTFVLSPFWSITGHILLLFPGGIRSTSF